MDKVGKCSQAAILQEKLANNKMFDSRHSLVHYDSLNQKHLLRQFYHKSVVALF